MGRSPGPRNVGFVNRPRIFPGARAFIQRTRRGISARPSSIPVKKQRRQEAQKKKNRLLRMAAADPGEGGSSPGGH